MVGANNRTWAWIDGVTPPPGIAGQYVHWGNWTVRKQVVSVEPNNWSGNESCAVSNSSTGYKNAYGWGDGQCSLNMTSICKTQRERQGPAVQLVQGVCGVMCVAWCSMAHDVCQWPTHPVALRASHTGF
jgi:hypothetical protein